MAFKKCANGHLYDPAIFGDKCPFCLPVKNIIDIMIELGRRTGMLNLIEETSFNLDFQTIGAHDYYMEKHPHFEVHCSAGHKYYIGIGANTPYCYDVTDRIMVNDCPICENTMRIKQWLCNIDGGEEVFIKFFDKSRYAAHHNQNIKTIKDEN